MLWFGLLFIAIVLFRPEGIAGAFQAWWKKLDVMALRMRSRGVLGQALRE